MFWEFPLDQGENAMGGTMIDLIKKAMLTGVGVAALTKEKVEEIAQEVIEKSKMSEQEGEKFVVDMMRRVDESKEAIKSQTDTAVQGVVKKMQFVKSEELESLREEITKLRDEVRALKSNDEEKPT